MLLSADSLQDLLGSIRRAINYARRQRIIDRNEAEAVELPHAGMRPGEIRALRWDDVLFEKKVVYVVRYLNTRGVREQTIADLMGHGNVTTFKKIYRQRLKPVVAEAAGIMNDI